MALETGRFKEFLSFHSTSGSNLTLSCPSVFLVLLQYLFTFHCYQSKITSAGIFRKETDIRGETLVC